MLRRARDVKAGAMSDFPDVGFGVGSGR